VATRRVDGIVEVRSGDAATVEAGFLQKRLVESGRGGVVPAEVGVAKVGPPVGRAAGASVLHVVRLLEAAHAKRRPGEARPRQIARQVLGNREVTPREIGTGSFAMSVVAHGIVSRFKLNSWPVSAIIGATTSVDTLGQVPILVTGDRARIPLNIGGLQALVAELLSADARFVHQAARGDREHGHSFVISTNGGGVVLAAAGSGGAARRSCSS